MKTSKTNAKNSCLNNKTQPIIGAGSYSRHTLYRLLDTAHHLRRAVRALQTLAPSKVPQLVPLLRMRNRVEGIARLVSEATKDLKLAGVSKNDPIIEINNRRLGLQQVSRRLRRARIQLDNNIAAMTTGHGHIQSIDGSNQGEIGTDLGKSPGDESIQNGGAIAAIITAGIALLGLLPDLFNQTDDDDARTRIAG